MRFAQAIFAAVYVLLATASSVAADDLSQLKSRAAQGSKEAMVALARSYGASKDFDDMLEGLYWWIKSGVTPRDEQMRLHSRLEALPYDPSDKVDIHGVVIGQYRWATEKVLQGKTRKDLDDHSSEFKIDAYQTLLVFYGSYQGANVVRQAWLTFESGTSPLEMSMNVARQYKRVWKQSDGGGYKEWKLRNGSEMTFKSMLGMPYMLQMYHRGFEKMLKDDALERQQQVNPNPKF